jgi:hypothetical protein
MKQNKIFAIETQTDAIFVSPGFKYSNIVALQVLTPVRKQPCVITAVLKLCEFCVRQRRDKVTYLQLHSDKTGRRNSGYKLENT